MTAAAGLTSTGSPMRPRAASGRQAGFTYLGLLILLAVIGLVGAASLKIGSLLQRVEAEQELLDIGAEFSDALQSYAAATPKGAPQQPPSLQELLKDPRFPGTRRHLRKLFVDPVTGKAEWGVMYLGDHVGVIGIYSLSQAKPFKVGNFEARFQHFENREHLSDWKFTILGQEKPLKPSLPPQPPAPLVPPAAPEQAAPPSEPAQQEPAEAIPPEQATER
jgi:type II secretory pathway pseudopilin PulG